MRKNVMMENMMKKLTVLALIMAVIVVSGCSPYKTSFQCPMGKGYACKSMSYVHEQVKQGKISDDIPDDQPKIYFPPQSDADVS